MAGPSTLPGGASELREALPSRRAPSANPSWDGMPSYAGSHTPASSTPAWGDSFSQPAAATALPATTAPAWHWDPYDSSGPPEDLNQIVASATVPPASTGFWWDSPSQPAATTAPPATPAPARDAFSGIDSYGPPEDLSQVVAPFMGPTSSTGSWGASLRQPAAATAPPATTAPAWDPNLGIGGSGAQDDLSRAVAPFVPPFTNTGVWRDSFSQPAPSFAPRKPSQRAAVQTTIASGSSRRTMWAGQIKPEDLAAWGRSIALGEKTARQVRKEVQYKYGAGPTTAKRWFETNSEDGLTACGRRIANPETAHNSPGTSLSEAQFRKLIDSCKSGQSIPASLASIGRGDISPKTAICWIDPKKDDGLSQRGKNILENILEKTRRNDSSADR